MTRNIAVILSGRDAGLARTLGAAAGAIRQFDTSVTGMGTRGSKVMAGLRLALQSVAVAAAVALGAAVVAAVKFEGAMRNVNTILRLGEPQFQAMSNAVLEMSTRLPQSATTLAEGLYQIVSSGFQGADALNVLEASATAASAGLTDTETAARTIVGVLNAYGLEAEDASYVSDVLFRTVELGVITFEELAHELGQVNAGAAAAGISIEEVGAAIATMTLSGLSASEATTSLNRLIREMITPNDALAAAFRKMGYESGLAAIQERGLHGVMEDLRVVTGGSIEMLARLFPEIRAARGAFALMTDAGQVYNRVFEAMNDRTDNLGATQAAFQEQMKGLGKQFQVFKNQITAVGIEIGAALIPKLRDAMSWVQRVGPQVGEGLANAWQAAQPAVRAIGDAISNVISVLKQLAQAVGPVLKTMAGMTFAVAIAGLTALATALGAVAGFLADHPALVLAVAAAYGAVLVGRLLSAAAAFIQLQAGLLAVRGGLLALAAGNAIGWLMGLTASLGFLGSALKALVTGNFGAALTNLGTGIRGIGTALAAIGPTLAGAAVVGGFIALTTAMQNSQQKAKELVSTLKGQFDMDTLAGLRGFVDASKEKLAGLDEEWSNMIGTTNMWSTGARQLFENLSPLPNKIQENKDATKALRAEMEAAQQRQLMWQHDIDTLSNTLGISAGEVENWLNKLEDYDPEDTAQTTGMLADQIRLMALEAANASPQAVTLADAIETMGDPTSTAAERIEDLNATIESLIGTVLGAFDALTGWGQAMDDLNAAVKENGFNLDYQSEAGRKVREAFSGAAAAAIEHAQAVTDETGSVAEGVDVLKQHREELINQVAGYVGSREAAEQYVNQLGLTPESISTLVQLAGVEKAIFSAEQMQETLRLVNLAKVNPQVSINSELFDNDAAKIGEVLAQIGLANPEATVYLDGKPFQATAEQVQAWALLYEASDPKAQALLDIIDPENKFDTLQAAAAGWDAVTAEATATVNNNDAMLKIAASKDAMFNWDASSGTADANADNSDAIAKIGDSKDRLADWNASRGTGRALGNNADALSKIRAAKDRLFNWDVSKGTSDVNANDNASSIIRQVQGLLAGLHDKTITITTRHLQEIHTADLARARPGRYGMLRMQEGGMTAGFADSPTVLFGERATGGEAFIPRFGNPNRSKMVLSQAAAWYGMQVIPTSDVPKSNINDMRTIVTVNVSAKSIMDGKTLVNAVKDTIGTELADHDRRLLRSLKSR